MAETFNILCLEENQEISRIIRSVYRDLDYQLECLHSSDELLNRLNSKSFQLLLINNAVGHFAASTFRRIKKENAGLYIILIDKSGEPAAAEWEVTYFCLAGSEELGTRLPLLLSDVYSKIEHQLYGGMPYWDTLRKSLNRLRVFLLVVSDAGEILFINKKGMLFLGVDEESFHGMMLQDFLADGSKSWKFIKENCCASQQQDSRFLMRFVNKEGQRVNKHIYASVIGATRSFWLLQEAHTQEQEDCSESLPDSQLLEKFADSVANELLNPLNVISGRLHLLKQELGPKWQDNKNLESINQQLERQSEIVTKLLTFARLKNDFIPQKVQLNEVLERLKLEPSVSRLLQRSNLTLEYRLDSNPVVLLGQLSHFDLLFKTLLEVSFDCVGTGGRVVVQTRGGEKDVAVRMDLRYPESLVGNTLTLLSFLGGFKSSPKRKSIETTIIRQIIQQYQGTYSLSQEDTYTEKFIMHFPYSQYTN